MTTVRLVSSTANSSLLVDQIPKQDILVVQGDWNAMAGDAQENVREIYGHFCNL